MTGLVSDREPNGPVTGTLRPTQRVGEELGISPTQTEVLIVLSGTDREQVGVSKLLDPSAVERLRAAHDLYRLAKSLPSSRRPELRALFDRFLRDVVRLSVGV